MNPLSPIASTVSLTLDQSKHNNATVVMNKADGWTVSLPAATGSGFKVRVYVGTSITSSTGIIAANGTDILAGGVDVATDASGLTIPTTATSDYITMNGGTTGGILGSYVDLQDVKTGAWLVGGFLVSTGAEATPFAAT
jgi:expansin (peptidoglycan-binding protein)